MCWVNRIRENPLAGMVSVGALGRCGILRRFRCRSSRRLLRNIEQRQVLNWSRPGKFRVVECGITFVRCRQLWPGKDEQGNVPQRGSQDSPVGHATLNTTIAEDIRRGNTLGHARPSEKGHQFAKKILMKAVPRNRQLRLPRSAKIYRDRQDLLLPKQAKRIDLESTRHPIIISRSALTPSGLGSIARGQNSR